MRLFGLGGGSSKWANHQLATPLSLHLNPTQPDPNAISAAGPPWFPPETLRPSGLRLLSRPGEGTAELQLQILHPLLRALGFVRTSHRVQKRPPSAYVGSVSIPCPAPSGEKEAAAWLDWLSFDGSWLVLAYLVPWEPETRSVGCRSTNLFRPFLPQSPEEEKKERGLKISRGP